MASRAETKIGFFLHSPEVIGFEHFHPSGPLALLAGGRKMLK
jgi:hypothetical protein